MDLKNMLLNERNQTQKATYYIFPFIYVFYFFNFILFLKLYIIVLVLPNIKKHRYADDTTLMAESEEELKSILMKVKRRVKKLA